MRTLADIVHDHGSWGIIGTLFAKLGEKKYERLDDGKREGYAELIETESRVYGPGETTVVLPVREGIHAMDNPTEGIAISVNVYGKTIGRGYVQFFDPARKTVSRVYPPRTFKEVLAIKALAAFGTGRAEAILQEALRESRPAAPAGGVRAGPRQNQGQVTECILTRSPHPRPWSLSYFTFSK